MELIEAIKAKSENIKKKMLKVIEQIIDCRNVIFGGPWLHIESNIINSIAEDSLSYALVKVRIEMLHEMTLACYGILSSIIDCFDFSLLLIPFFLTGIP